MPLNLGDPEQPGYLDVDFYAGSLHKMMGPTGIGFLYGRPECLDSMRPFMVGGSTIFETSIRHRPLYAEWPDRFEAGLQNYAGLIGAGVAADYLRPLLTDIKPYERHLNAAMTEILAPLHEKEQLRILGPLDPAKRGGIITVVVPAEQQDNAFQQFENDAVEANVMYRAGHFCVDSWFNSHSNRLPNRYMAVRFSLYVYNTVSEVEKAASLVAHAFGGH
jgi:cysteine desulfurase/selenocysteine lyase